MVCHPPSCASGLPTLIRTSHEGVLLFCISAPGTDPMSPVKLQFVAVVMGSAPQMRDIVYNHYTNSHKFRDPSPPRLPFIVSRPRNTRDMRDAPLRASVTTATTLIRAGLRHVSGRRFPEAKIIATGLGYVLKIRNC